MGYFRERLGLEEKREGERKLGCGPFLVFSSFVSFLFPERFRRRDKEGKPNRGHFICTKIIILSTQLGKFV